MLFNSFDFLVFFVVVLALQAVLPHRPRNLFLLGASYLFYGWWDWRFLSLLWVSTLVEFYCGGAIARSADPGRRRLLLGMAVAVDLGMLGFFKYCNFFVGSFAALLTSLGVQSEPWHLNVVLPVGISFYTFQTLSYTIDVYRGQMKPVEKLADFALFVTFFPQLVAGPIERACDLAPQMARKPHVSLAEFQHGCWLVFWGFFKKVVIADNLSDIAGRAYADTSLAGGDVWVGVVAFAFQIYGDFSGYSDIARGAARMLGYNLMLNFRVPYFATNPREFWARWHVSLSTWLRDYLYIPLGGNRGGAWLTYRNLALTMLLGGLWHGAAWTFVLWGAYQGVLLIGHRLALQAGLALVPKGRLMAAAWWVVRVAVMFQLVCVGWLIFRSPSLSGLWHMVQGIVTNPVLTGEGLRWLWQIAALCWPLCLVQILQEATGDIDIVLRLSAPLRGAFYAVLAVMLCCLGDIGGSEFIYFQF